MGFNSGFKGLSHHLTWQYW